MNTITPYRDRIEAGRALARRLGLYGGRPDTVVLGLPRGGMPVALEVSKRLEAPLDVFLVRKLTLRSKPDVVFGVIASGGVTVLNEDAMSEQGVGADHLSSAIDRESAELRRLEETYRGGRPALSLEGRIVLVVDDGIATDASLGAVFHALAAQGPIGMVLAAPVGATEACARLAGQVDDLVCPLQPEPFFAVGCWYDQYPETGDEEVRECLVQSGAAV